MLTAACMSSYVRFRPIADVRDKRGGFALRALLHLLGSAADLDVAFISDADGEATRDFMDLLHGEGGAWLRLRSSFAVRGRLLRSSPCCPSILFLR